MNQTPAVAAQIIISIIPIVGIVMAAIVAFFYILWHHRRSILLIKSGQYRKPEFDLLSFSLLTGLLLFSIGLVLTIFLSLLTGVGYALLGGMIPLSIGIGLLAFYGVKRGDKAS